MSDFLKWWWNEQSHRTQRNAVEWVGLAFTIIAGIAILFLFIIDWRLLCIGSIFVYVAGLAIGGIWTVLFTYNKWVEYKQARENEDD